jgi:hypothetical protein
MTSIPIYDENLDTVQYTKDSKFKNHQNLKNA